MIRLTNRQLITDWYIKNIFSGRYLNFLSNNPIQQKIVIVQNLVDTVINLTHNTFYDKNLEKIK